MSRGGGCFDYPDIQLWVQGQVAGDCGAKVGEFVDNFQDLFVDGVCWGGVEFLAHDVGFLQADGEEEFSACIYEA